MMIVEKYQCLCRIIEVAVPLDTIWKIVVHHHECHAMGDCGTVWLGHGALRWHEKNYTMTDNKPDRHGPEAFGTTDYTRHEIWISDIPWHDNIRTIAHELGHVMAWVLQELNTEGEVDANAAADWLVWSAHNFDEVVAKLELTGPVRLGKRIQSVP